MLGFNTTSPNHVEWYISVMLFSMFIIFPILRYKYSLFVCVISPALSLVVTGYLFHTYHSLTGVMVWEGFFYKSMLRGIVEICIGISSFEVARYIKSNYDFTRHSYSRLLITIVQILLFISYCLLVMTALHKKYEFFALLLAPMLLIVAYNRLSLFSSLFDNSFIFTLGKLTLPLYLSQVAAINFIRTFSSSSSQIMLV